MADDFEPLLQIVHISDLHVVDINFPGWPGLRKVQRILGFISADLERQLLDGTAPHDPLAPDLFLEFLHKITKNDADWSKLETWIVDTGDLSTFGDTPSLTEGQTHLQRFAQKGSLASIHGNHDAWPQSFPFFAPANAVASQILEIIKRGYRLAQPFDPLQIRIPNSTNEIQLYTMDSVIFDCWDNSFARGNVELTQLQDLATLVDSNQRTSSSKHFKILAVHHPVHYPGPRPSFHQMVLKNDRVVAQNLDNSTPAGSHPQVHLLLSGHTHFLFPSHGQLPQSARHCNHGYVGIDQAQFVVGSLMQLDRFNKRGGYPHQCQVLRIYYSPSRPNIILLERLLAARPTGQGAVRGAGSGPYQFMPHSSDGRLTEEIVFTL